MPAPKTVLCIMDMAAVGRASLASALPALAACGVQACPLPASLFSSHTGGFANVFVQNTAGYADATLDRMQAEGLAFDAVYVGYLRGEAQMAAAARALQLFNGALKVVDPALGDNGRAYAGIDKDTITGMAQLCREADLITPNATECALLAGEDPLDPRDVAALRKLAAGLVCEGSGGGSYLLTSVPADANLRVGDAESMGIAGLDTAAPAGEQAFSLSTRRLPQSYPGAGDLFTASVVGLLLAGLPLQSAAREAAVFVGAAVTATWRGGGEPRMGLWFEPYLPLLMGAAATGQDPEERAADLQMGMPPDSEDEQEEDA